MYLNYCFVYRFLLQLTLPRMQLQMWSIEFLVLHTVILVLTVENTVMFTHRKSIGHEAFSSARTCLNSQCLFQLQCPHKIARHMYSQKFITVLAIYKTLELATESFSVPQNKASPIQRKDLAALLVDFVKSTIL